jgi:heme/copper-type cytochrome/quinol oxidase subunit 1
MSDPKSFAASPRTSKYAVWAIIVMVIGWLIALTTGLCTGVLVIAGLSDSGGGEFSGSDLAIMGLIIGGIPCLVGIGMILAARKWGRRKASPADPNVFT